MQSVLCTRTKQCCLPNVSWRLFFQLFFPCLVFVLGRQNGVSGEVPDDVVYTDLHKTVRLGESVVLKCQFRGRPLAVYWKKGDDPRTAPNLVSWIPGDPVTGLCEGERPCQIMDMNEDFSLIIREVTIAEQGRYICRVSSYKGILIHNLTDISVFSTPTKPYPFINECLGSPDKNQKCIISTTDPINISCSASGYYPDLDLFFLHDSQDVATMASKESTNEDGTKHKSIIARASPSQEPYDCVASDIPGVARQSIASVLVNFAPFPVVTETTETASNPNKAVDKHKHDSTKIAVILSICGCILPMTSVLIFCICRRRKRNYVQLKLGERKDEGLVSYLELWELVKMGDIVVGDSVVSKLVGNPDRELEYDYVRSKASQYRELCEWKDRRPRDVRTLYEAMEEMGLHIELKLMRDFRARNDEISNDDLEHICWHVSGCRKTVKPILRVLYSHGEKMTKPTEDHQTPENPRCDVIRDDLQLLKGWKTKLMATHPEEGGNKDPTVEFRAGLQVANIQDKTVKKSQTDQDEDDSNEQTPMHPAEPEEVDLKAKTVPPNQVIRICLALEEAGKKAVKSDQLVYQQLAKTFFAIEEKNKSEITDKMLQKFALVITRRHCKRLGESLKLRERDIDARNEEDLCVMFRTDIMLKKWISDQQCSNYEIRCRLRTAAEQCSRHDVADVFINKDQSKVMSSISPPPVSLTFTNEKQSPEVTTQEGITAISREELDRIGRYAGTACLLACSKKYGIAEVPEQQSPEGNELPFETKIINTLKPKLDLEHNRKATPRNVLREFLECSEYSPYACLLPKRKEGDIFNVELIELAFRLVMTDVYPFVEALCISDHLLTSYKPNFGPRQFGQGTFKMLQEVKTDVRKLGMDGRFELVKALRNAGYPEEAKLIYFGFEIGLGDVAEVENRVDMAQLAQLLCVPDDIQGMSQDNQTIGDERQRSVLLRWKDTVRSSPFNQRLALADALFNMGEKQLALDIISGKFRNRVITNLQSELLAKTIPEGQLSELSQVLGQKVKRDQSCQDIITAWASIEKLLKIFETKPMKLSNQLLAAGFYDFAQEIMAGARRGKEDKKAAQKETEDKPVTTSEESPHEDSTGKEQGAVQDKEDNESMEKDTVGNTHPQNTGKEGAGAVKKNEVDSKTVAHDAETVKTVESYGGKTKEKGGSQEKNNTNNVAVGETGEDNASATKESELPDVKEEGAVPKEMNTTETAHSINERGGRPEESNKSGQERQPEAPLRNDADFDHWSHSNAEAVARSIAYM